MKLAALLPLLPLVIGQPAGLRVRLRVFSGTEDPLFQLSSDVTEELLPKLEAVDEKAPLTFRMGYRGFEVALTSGPKLVWATPELELQLLDAAVAAGAVGPRVESHVMEEILRTQESHNWVNGALPAKPVPSDSCKAPVVGPDSGSPKFDPTADDCGFFVVHQSENNCYDYGTDVATNTFAQPGRGSGHKWDENTCDSIRAAAERDGLTWLGTDLPGADLKSGHYVALYIWPETNFHWARRDSSGTWSHKPGGTPVQNADNEGRTITDPSKADLSPWSQFCGYMSVVPSTVCVGSSHCINSGSGAVVV